jgi:hypothetical protein
MTDQSETSPQTNHWRRRSKGSPLPPEEAARQGEITRLAFLLLGREQAIEFLNSDHPGLGARPLALPTASDVGRDSVEGELGRMNYRQPAVGYRGDSEPDAQQVGAAAVAGRSVVVKTRLMQSPQAKLLCEAGPIGLEPTGPAHR